MALPFRNLIPLFARLCRLGLDDSGPLSLALKRRRQRRYLTLTCFVKIGFPSSDTESDNDEREDINHYRHSLAVVWRQRGNPIVRRGRTLI